MSDRRWQIRRTRGGGRAVRDRWVPPWRRESRAWARRWVGAGGADRGDVPGWVMVTLMTAGLVLALWAVAGPRLEAVFNDAINRVVGGP